MFAVEITLIQFSFEVKTNFLKFGHKIVRKLNSSKKSTTNSRTAAPHYQPQISYQHRSYLPVMILRTRILIYTIWYNVYVHLWITEYFSRYTTDTLAIRTSFRIRESLVFAFFTGYCTSPRIKASILFFTVTSTW